MFVCPPTLPPFLHPLFQPFSYQPNPQQPDYCSQCKVSPPTHAQTNKTLKISISTVPQSLSISPSPKYKSTDIQGYTHKYTFHTYQNKLYDFSPPNFLLCFPPPLPNSSKNPFLYQPYCSFIHIYADLYTRVTVGIFRSRMSPLCSWSAIARGLQRKVPGCFKSPLKYCKCFPVLDFTSEPPQWQRY